MAQIPKRRDRAHSRRDDDRALFTGAAISTLAPGAGEFFGSFTGALLGGALSVFAVFDVCAESTR